MKGWGGIALPLSLCLGRLSRLRRVDEDQATRGRQGTEVRAFMQKRSRTRYWSGRVTRTSNALDLEAHVFTKSNPRQIALSLKRSAEASRRRKARPYQSAMSMLNFYINRAGSGLSQKQKRVLTRAKNELRKVFHRESKADKG